MTTVNTPGGLPYPDGAETPDVSRDFKALAEAIEAKVQPVGLVAMYAGSTIPANWLLCNGQAVSASYPKLKALMANTPNLIDKFVLGASTPGAAGGSKKISTSNLPSHNHAATGLTASATTTGNTSAVHNHNENVQLPDYSVAISSTGSFKRHKWLIEGLPSEKLTGVENQNHTHTVPAHAVTGNTANTGGATDYMPPYYALCYIIRAV